MKEIVRAVISSFIEDARVLPRKTKIILIAVTSTTLILISGILFCLHSGSSIPIQKQSGLSPLSITDAKGDTWILNLIKGQPLRKIKNSSSKPGPPLLVKTDVRQISMYEMSIGLTVEGQAGEKYLGGIIKNGELQPPPKFNIVNQRDKVLAFGQFEYG